MLAPSFTWNIGTAPPRLPPSHATAWIDPEDFAAAEEATSRMRKRLGELYVAEVESAEEIEVEVGGVFVGVLDELLGSRLALEMKCQWGSKAWQE